METPAPGWLSSAAVHSFGATPETTPALLFHGTSEPIAGPLRVGGYDGVLWFADNPAIAQAYIPDAGIKCLYAPRSYREDEAVRPPQMPGDLPIDFVLAVQMGYRVSHLEYDTSQQLRAFSWGKGDWPRYRDVRRYVTDSLGYRIGENGSVWLKESRKEEFIDAGCGVSIAYRVMESDFSIDGSLFVVPFDPDWKLLDISTGEGDLTAPSYNRLGLFRRAEAEGYDGIIIDDFAQTDLHGNVGHRSWGLFKRAAGAINPICLTARRQDDCLSGSSVEWARFMSSVRH